MVKIVSVSTPASKASVAFVTGFALLMIVLLGYLGAGMVVFGEDLVIKVTGVIILSIPIGVTIFAMRYIIYGIESKKILERIASSIIEYRDGILYIRDIGREFMPGILRFYTTVETVGGGHTPPQRYIRTRYFFISIPLLSGLKEHIDFRYAFNHGYVFAVNSDGEGIALIPAYCGNRCCISVLDPMFNKDTVLKGTLDDITNGISFRLK